MMFMLYWCREWCSQSFCPCWLYSCCVACCEKGSSFIIWNPSENVSVLRSKQVYA